MKKIACTLLASIVLICGVFAQEALPTVKLTMVDSVECEMTLFKKGTWSKQCVPFMKEQEPRAFSLSVNTDGTVKDNRISKDDWFYTPFGLPFAKEPSDPGQLVNKDYNENDNESVAQCFQALRENDCVYGIGYVKTSDKITRYMIAVKGKKLIVNRYSWYKETNKDFREGINNEVKKRNNINDFIDSLFGN